jgi:hypothetical protein
MEQEKENRFLTVLKDLWRTVLGFGRAQLILLGVNFTVVTVGMLIVGLKWWSPLVALAVSLLDLLPVIGSGVVFVPWAIVALIVKNTHMAIAVGATISPWCAAHGARPDRHGQKHRAAAADHAARFGRRPGRFRRRGRDHRAAIAAVANVIYRVLFKRKAAGQRTNSACETAPGKTEKKKKQS